MVIIKPGAVLLLKEVPSGVGAREARQSTQEG